MILFFLITFFLIYPTNFLRNKQGPLVMQDGKWCHLLNLAYKRQEKQKVG